MYLTSCSMTMSLMRMFAEILAAAGEYEELNIVVKKTEKYDDLATFQGCPTK